MPPGITARQLPGAVGGSCKGRHKLAGPYAAYFAALVPLRVYPNESVPSKDLFARARKGLAHAGQETGNTGRMWEGGVITFNSRAEWRENHAENICY